MFQHPTLYKRDQRGNVRTWSMVSVPDEAQYRTQAGILDGAQVVSGWTTVVGKQGRTDAEQVEFEVAAAYRHQLERDYFEKVEEIDTPRIVLPMLASKYSKFKRGYVQPKLDGMRCIATANGLFSRQGKPILSVPHIIETLAPFFDRYPDAILDGELYNHELKDQFERLMSLCRKTKNLTAKVLEETKVVQYHIYDYPSAPGGFGDRWGKLNEDISIIVPEGALFAKIHLVHTVHCGAEALFDHLFDEWLDLGYEGGIWRDPEGPYVFDGRPKWLQKRVIMMSAEFPLVRLELGNGNWAGLPKSAVFKDPETGQEFSTGIAGDMEAAAELLNRELASATVNFKGWTKNRIPRCGVVKDWHGPEGRQD
jgi:DNA ligase-1